MLEKQYLLQFLLQSLVFVCVYMSAFVCVCAHIYTHTDIYTSKNISITALSCTQEITYIVTKFALQLFTQDPCSNCWL